MPPGGGATPGGRADTAVGAAERERRQAGDASAFHGYLETEIGLLEVAAGERAVTAVEFVDTRRPGAHDNAIVRSALAQLDEYFAGQRRTFDLPLEPAGTAFQTTVWKRLLEVPYGVTIAYRDVAESIGRPRAVRAVGAANGANPIAVVVPCHRIIGSNGNLTGYGGGLWRKEWLLKLEGALLL